jgi:hypothetical protein
MNPLRMSSFRSSFRAASLLVVLSACGGSGNSTHGAAGGAGQNSGGAAGTATGGSATSGGSTSAGTGGTAGGAGSGGATGVQCWPAPEVFPTFDRSCGVDDSCAIVSRQTDCCGSFALLGVVSAEVERFEVAAQACSGQYPDCDCPTQPIATDSGDEAQNPADVAIECRDGVCTTFVP